MWAFVREVTHGLVDSALRHAVRVQQPPPNLASSSQLDTLALCLRGLRRQPLLPVRTACQRRFPAARKPDRERGSDGSQQRSRRALPSQRHEPQRREAPPSARRRQHAPQRGGGADVAHAALTCTWPQLPISEVSAPIGHPGCALDGQQENSAVVLTEDGGKVLDEAWSGRRDEHSAAAERGESVAHCGGQRHSRHSGGERA